jgi:poly(A) polymerase
VTERIESLPEDRREWLDEPALQAVFDAIEAAGGEARIAGGAVRNSLMGYPVSDVDLSTTLKPEVTIQALESAGLRAVPTGIDHGTITGISNHKGYEITTLRRDVETDGRRARVAFSSNWEGDASRRDLTINALYCTRDGVIFDPLEGLPDIRTGTIRFIGDAEARIGEDHLRILRFFRFFAWYGRGRPDAAGIKACAKMKEKLKVISTERIWAELSKLLAAADPGRALLWMRTTGVLGVVLPETEKWGIDLIPHLTAFEADARRKPDALLRLMAMVPPDPQRITAMARRLRTSKREEKRLLAWTMCQLPDSLGDHAELAKALYRGNPNAIRDRLALEAARLRSRDDNSPEQIATVTAAFEYAEGWKRPEFPLVGEDMIRSGMQKGPELGRMLRKLEDDWVESGFELGKESLLSRLH